MTDIEKIVATIESASDEDIQIFKTFSAEIMNHAAELTSSLDANNVRLYTVTVHGMKSALRIIGAVELGEFAFRLECASKNDELEFEICRKETGDFIQQVTELAEAIKSELKLVSKNTQTERAEESEVKEILRELLKACKNFNLTLADSFCSELKKKTVNPELDQKLAEIIEKVDTVEYDEAAEEIEKLLG